MINIFENPKIYKREIIEKIRIPIEKRKKFNGKSFTCVSFTGFCRVGCPFCFYKSNDRKIGLPLERLEFSDYGFERFLEFLNKSNNGYLLVAGGGEPFEKQEYVMQTVSKAISDRIVLVTSGMWAKNYDQAEEIILELYNRLNSRTSRTHLVLRLSVDKCHYRQLGFDVVNNIISVFKKYFKQNENFELQIHTMLNDNTMDEVIEKLGNCKKVNHEIKPSDNNQTIKIIPERYKLVFDDGYEVVLGMAKVFHSNLMVDINDTERISHALSIFDEDMKCSEHGNPSLLESFGGQLGFDFWLNYNGNISTWGNQSLDDVNNIYIDDYEKIIQDAYENIIYYSVLDKGHVYREKIINEVNPKAVLRAKAINIRDYAPTVLLEEIKTVLYYAVIVIKNYLAEGKLTCNDISNLSDELLETINKSKQEIQKLYVSSNYCILDQYLNKKEFNLLEWLDLYTLIKKGHYDVSSGQIAKDMAYIRLFHKNEMTDDTEQLIKTIDKKSQYNRRVEKVTAMKPEAVDFCVRRNNLGVLKKITPMVRIVIEKDGYILLSCATKENIRFKQDMFSLPGGRVEHTESSKDAAIRKIHDEIDYKGKIRITGFLGILENIWDNNGRPYHEMDIVFRAAIDSVDVNNPPKGKEGDIEFHWCKIEDMDSLNILPKSFVKLVPQWLHRSKSVKLIDVLSTEIFGELK